MAKSLWSSLTGLIVGVVLSWAWVPQAARAAVLAVEPMFQEVVLDTVASKTTEVRLTNSTPTPMSFQVKVYDFGSLDDSGGVAFLGGTKNFSERYRLASWINLDHSELTLAGGSSEAVQVTVRNDETLSPGSHYAAVVFQSTEANQADTDNAVAIDQMIASLIFVKKINGATYGIEVEGWQVQRPWLGSPSLELTLRNSGNTHIVPRGTARLYDPVDRLTAQAVVNEASALILPESKRVFSLTLKPVNRAWFPGWYTLRLSYRYDGTDNFLVREERYFVVPPLAWAGLFFLGGVIVVWRAWRKRSKRSPKTS